MKSLLLILVAAIFSFNILASDTTIVCPDSNAGIVALINAPEVYCNDAINIASQCAFGSSRDLEITGAAKVLCLKEAGKLSNEDQKLLNTLEERCNKTFSKLQGTLFLSLNAFCHLQAASFIRNVQSGGVEEY
jgi:hypothetical protein